MKKIRITQNGHVWEAPLEVIADHRAKYYAENDKDTTYQQEFDYVMNDDYEGLDWYQNNMDFKDIKSKAAFTPADIPDEPNLHEDSEKEIIDNDGEEI